MGSIGMTEIILIFLVVLLVFGAKRIPEIARGMGKGIREFKDATKDIQRELTIEEQQQQYNRIQPPRQGTATPYAANTYQAAPPPPAPAPQPAPTEHQATGEQR
jgi:sec-independent protein translocase protein TatA